MVQNTAGQMCAEMLPLPVPTHFIYSDGVDTPTTFTYENDEFDHQPEVGGYLPGDDTILSSSIEALANAWEEAGTEVYLHKCPTTDKMHHKDLIACPWTLSVLDEILSADAQQEDDVSRDDQG